jgi:hypothetical protein
VDTITSALYGPIWLSWATTLLRTGALLDFFSSWCIVIAVYIHSRGSTVGAGFRLRRFVLGTVIERKRRRWGVLYQLLRSAARSDSE